MHSSVADNQRFIYENRFRKAKSDLKEYINAQEEALTHEISSQYETKLVEYDIYLLIQDILDSSQTMNGYKS
jgi:hypothetical protein